MSHHKRTLGALAALASLVCLPLMGAESERFSVSVGNHDNLLIAGPGGDTAADVAGQTVDQTVSFDGTTLRVSFGRDASGLLTATLAAPNLNEDALHFSAGGKSIDAEKAVVTLTFSSDLKDVLIDPGYVGTVDVDSHLLRARSLADDQPISPEALAAIPSDMVTPGPTPAAPAPAPASVTPTPAPSSVASANTTVEASTVPLVTATPSTDANSSGTPIAAAPAPAPAVTPAPAPDPAKPDVMPSAPPLIASEVKPILPPLADANENQAAPKDEEPLSEQLARDAASITPNSPIGPDGSRQVKLYWSEPVKGPGDIGPAIGLDEIKLVEVHGLVTVTLPGGSDQAGTEGMVVPSGSTVRTSENASAALYMGGVNSARLMPKCELVVTQTLVDSVRTDTIKLSTGAVFSRIGHRSGEVEKYSVVTPEGTSEAGTTDMLAFRGSPGDLGERVTTRAGLLLDERRLLAWDPAPANGLISDVPSWLTSGTLFQVPSSYFYYPQFNGPINPNAIPSQVLSALNSIPGPKGSGPQSQGQSNSLANQHANSQTQAVLQTILEILQPFNTKLDKVLSNISRGRATSAELAFYADLTTVFFTVQEPGLYNQFLHNPALFYKNRNLYARILQQDLNELGIPGVTPH